MVTHINMLSACSLDRVALAGLIVWYRSPLS